MNEKEFVRSYLIQPIISCGECYLSRSNLSQDVLRDLFFAKKIAEKNRIKKDSFLASCINSCLNCNFDAPQILNLTTKIINPENPTFQEYLNSRKNSPKKITDITSLYQNPFFRKTESF